MAMWGPHKYKTTNTCVIFCNNLPISVWQWIRPVTHTHTPSISYCLLLSFSSFTSQSPSSPSSPLFVFPLSDYLLVKMTDPRLCVSVCASAPRWARLGEISAVRADGREVRAALCHPGWAAVCRAAVSQRQRASPSGHPGERRAAARG